MPGPREAILADRTSRLRHTRRGSSASALPPRGCDGSSWRGGGFRLPGTGMYSLTLLSNNLHVCVEDTDDDKEFEWTNLLLHLTRAPDTRYNLPPLTCTGNPW